ncbi:MAG: hypothetical protein L3J91_05175, partial [Thermoplasmata archaeon]|nr:hypothetical protein [Thermoplasmata archaeon]
MTGSGRRALEGASLPILGGVGLVLLLCLPVVAVGHGASTPGSPVDRSVPTAAVGLCSGASTARAFVGSLFADSGGTTPPNVGGVGLSLSYWADLNYTPKGGSSTYSCVPESAAVTTNTSGSFYLTAPLPGSGCNGASCSFYSGPYGPLLFSVPAGLPGGYFLTQSVNGNQVGLAFVDALTSTSLVPSSRVTLSANAPTVVHAFPRAGNGAPSPATVGFAWRLEGAGWSVLNGSGNSSVTIEANDRASPGTLTVWVNGSYSGTSLVAPPVTLEIAAATTTTTGGSAYPTSLDVGSPVTFGVMGQGAGGYTYTADIFPGLGLPTVVAPCTTSIVAGGLVALTCSTSVTYTTPGLAQPSANLTNGY